MGDSGGGGGGGGGAIHPGPLCGFGLSSFLFCARAAVGWLVVDLCSTYS